MIEQVVYEPSVLDRRLIEHPVEVATVAGLGMFVVIGVSGIVVLGWLAGLALAVGLGLVMALMAIGMSRSLRRQVGQPRPAPMGGQWWVWVVPLVPGAIHNAVFFTAGLGTALVVDGALLAVLFVVGLLVRQRRKRSGSATA